MTLFVPVALLVFTSAIAVSPGPLTLASLARGTLAARLTEILPFAFGGATAYGLVWGAAASSTRALAAVSPEVFAMARWAAAAILLWFALRMFRSAFRPDDAPPPPRRSGLREALTGAGVITCNPKCWATAIVAAALFCEPDIGPGGHAIVFGGLATLLVALSCAGYGWGGMTLARRLNRRGKKWLTIGSAGLMAASVLTLA